MPETLNGDYIKENILTPISHSTVVAVAGGGIAGISAALAAARCGADVMLIESQYALGGLATLGLITYYLPICDGYGHQVVYGIGEELLKLAIKHGCEGKPPIAWLENGTFEEKCVDRFKVGFNASMFCLESEKLLTETGVRILYGTKVCGATVENGFIKALIIENKSGRSAIKVSTVIDATGDSDVATYCGANTVLYKEKNTLAGWYYYMYSGQRRLQMLGPSDIPEDEEKITGKHTRQICDRRFSGIDGDEISEMTVMSHEATYAHIIEARKTRPDYIPTNIAMIPQLRMTRRIVGRSEMKKSQNNKHVRDSVGLISDWRRRGPIYEVPFGALCSDSINNLYAAGRNISSDDLMWDITRVIPPCAVFGEAAGCAAALSSSCNFDHRMLKIDILQEKLTDFGVKLHTTQVI